MNILDKIKKIAGQIGIHAGGHALGQIIVWLIFGTMS